MIKTTYQTPEIRDENDNIIQEGAFGKNTALSNATNDGWTDYVINNLEALHDVVGESSPTLDANGHVVEPANLAIGDEDGNRIKTSYLKTSGGTVNGAVNIAQNLKMQDNQENVFGGMYVPASSATEQYLQLYGGENTGVAGAKLTLRPDGDGRFELTAKSADGGNTYTLTNNNSGALLWRGGELAPKASPAFTGNPTVPTQATNNNSTRVANTEFVNNELKASAPYLGSSSVFYTQLTSNDDLNNIQTVGTYWWNSKPANSPNISYAKMFVMNGHGSSSIIQIVIASGNGNMYRRALNGGSWNAWKQVAYAEDVLPLSGGVITGNTALQDATLYLRRTNIERGTNPSANVACGIVFTDKNNTDIGSLWRSIGSNGTNSARLYCAPWAGGSQSYVAFDLNVDATNKTFYPSADDSVNLGRAPQRWKQLYAGTTTIATSDERLKDNIEAIPDEVLDAWSEVNWYQYQFKDSIDEKGKTKARIHTGAIAQRIESVFESHNLDANRYGLLCYDKWDATPAERDDNGNIINPARPAGNRYSLRYEEALCMEAAYQRRRADRLEERIARLEALIRTE